MVVQFVKFPSSGGAGSFAYSWLMSLTDFSFSDSQAFFFGLSTDAGQGSDQTIFSHSLFINDTTTTSSSPASVSIIVLPAPIQSLEPSSAEGPEKKSTNPSRAATTVEVGVGFGLSMPLVLLVAYVFIPNRMRDKRLLQKRLSSHVRLRDKNEGASTGVGTRPLWAIESGEVSPKTP
jgi:hypothetical protein